MPIPPMPIADDQAMGLLAAFGEKPDEARKFLADVRASIVAYEKAEAAANERQVEAGRRIEQANAAESRAKQAQDKLDRDRAAHASDVAAHNAKVAQDRSDITTARVALEQREETLKAAEDQHRATIADLAEQRRQLVAAQDAAQAIRARYETAIAKLAIIVKDAQG